MDIASVDRSATLGIGPLRAASPDAKLAALALVLAAVLTSWNILVIAAIFLLIVAALVWGRVDVRLALSLAAYPSLFALAFALASAPDAIIGAAIVAKAVTAALAAVTLALSTPYPQVFARVQRVVPGIVGDALLMTYRTTFLLLKKMSDLVRAVRLRAGLRGRSAWRSLRTTASALGALMLYAVDLAQRDYDVLWLRGYTGRLRVSPPPVRDRRADAAIVTAALAALAVSVIWRVASRDLNPFSWIVLLPALALCAAATLGSWRKDGR